MYDAQDPLVGQKVVALRRLTDAEVEAQGWEVGRWTSVTALVFEDGTLVYASRDEEGNGPGQLFGRAPGAGDDTFFQLSIPPGQP